MSGNSSLLRGMDSQELSLSRIQLWFATIRAETLRSIQREDKKQSRSWQRRAIIVFNYQCYLLWFFLLSMTPQKSYFPWNAPADITLEAYLAIFTERCAKIWRGLLFNCQSPISDYLHNNFIFPVYGCIVFQSWSKSSILEPSECENCKFYTPGGLIQPPLELTGKF